ncbi:MAG: alpha/beta hydrolase family protein [Pirellulales bacterium]
MPWPVSRRTLLAVGLASSAGAAITPRALPAWAPDVAPPDAPPAADAGLLHYQRHQHAATRAALAQLRTPSDLHAYQRQVRAAFQQVLGAWPEASPLNPRLTGTLSRDGYDVEKRLLESQPGFYVPLNLYVPTGARAAPAVLCPVGHAPAGKAHRERDSYQALFITLARLGFVVCAFDPLGQGEREPYGAATGNHHAIQGYQCLPTGRHLAQYFIWDALRCLDYLAARPEVDPQRMACVGCSGGGAVTQYLAALDERIAVAIPASWITTTARLTEDDGLHVESWFPRLAAPSGAGTLQLLACIVPRPLLLLGNQDDAEFPPAEMHSVYTEARELYARQQAADQIEYQSVPTRHGFWPAARLEVYRFLQRHLKPPEEAVAEPPVTAEDEATLWCAPRGQVRNLPGAKTVFDLNREEVGRLRRQRQERRRITPTAQWRAQLLGFLPQLCDDTTAARLALPRYIGAGRSHDVPFRRYLLERTPDDATWLDIYDTETRATPLALVIADELALGERWAAAFRSAGHAAWLLHGPMARDRMTVMVGRYRLAHWGTWVQAVAAAHDVLAPARGAPIGLLLGVGPTASWAVQLAPLLAELAPDRASRPLDSCPVVALQGYARLESFCDQPATSHRLLASPGLWRWLDEVDLAAALAPRSVWLAQLREPAGRDVSEDTLHQQFSWALQHHEQQGSRLRISGRVPTVDELADWCPR